MPADARFERKVIDLPHLVLIEDDMNAVLRFARSFGGHVTVSFQKEKNKHAWHQNWWTPDPATDDIRPGPHRTPGERGMDRPGDGNAVTGKRGGGCCARRLGRYCRSGAAGRPLGARIPATRNPLRPVMALRFRRTLRVAPGIRLNLSKSGVSTSVGPRGASLTLGRRGIYANAGLPGTGLSYRTRLDGKSKTAAPEASAPAVAQPLSDAAALAAAEARLSRVQSDLKAHRPVPRSFPQTAPATLRRPAPERALLQRLLLDPCGRGAFILRSAVLWLGLWVLSENFVAGSWQSPSLWPLRLDAELFGLLLVGAGLLQLVWAVQRGRDIGLPVAATVVAGIVAGALGGWAVLIGLAALVFWPGRSGDAAARS